MTSLGLVVPCRNEASVVARKLRNLQRLDWPVTSRAHRVLLVDDHSEDGTAEVARAELRLLAFPQHVEVEVLTHSDPAGKPAAVRAGLAALGDRVDCVGLTDADVLLDVATIRLALAAFEQDADLAMLCGEQVFARELPGDGRAPEVDAPRTADAYDRATAWWRRVESRFGALFSVHGQFLVWRQGLALEPQLGLAADDLDLMLQVRTLRPRGKTRLIAGARFFERKTPPGESADAQALRRARAYVQLVRSGQLPKGQSLARKLQWLAYRNLPLAAPYATLLAVILLLTSATIWWGLVGLFAAALTLGAAALTRPGRVWLRSMRMIRQALRLESRGTLPQSWEMARTQ